MDAPGPAVMPNGNADTDMAISVVAHEIAEWATNPDGNAWWDTDDDKENGDKVRERGGGRDGSVNQLACSPPSSLPSSFPPTSPRTRPALQCNFDFSQSWNNCRGQQVSMFSDATQRHFLVQSNYVLSRGGCRMAITPTPAAATCPPTPSPPPSISRTPSVTPTRSRTASRTPSRSRTGSHTPTPSMTPTQSATPTASLTVGVSASTTATASYTPSSTGSPSASCFWTPSPMPSLPGDSLYSPRGLLALGRPPEPDRPFLFGSLLPAGLPELGGPTAGGGFFQTLLTAPMSSGLGATTNSLGACNAPPSDPGGAAPLFGGSAAAPGPDGSDVTVVCRGIAPDGSGKSLLSFATLSFSGAVDVATPGLGELSTDTDLGGGGGKSRRRALLATVSPSSSPLAQAIQAPVAAAHLGDGRSFVTAGVDGSVALLQRTGSYWDRSVAVPLPLAGAVPPGAGVATLQLGFAPLPTCGKDATCAAGAAGAEPSLLLARGSKVYAVDGLVGAAAACGNAGRCVDPAKTPAAPGTVRSLLATSTGGDVTAFALSVPPPGTAAMGVDGPAAAPPPVLIVASNALTPDGATLPALEAWTYDYAAGGFGKDADSPLLGGDTALDGGIRYLDSLAGSGPSSNKDTQHTIVGLTVLDALSPCFIRRTLLHVVTTEVVRAGTGGGRRLTAAGAPSAATFKPGVTVPNATRLLLFDPNFPKGSPGRLRDVSGGPNGGGGVGSFDVAGITALQRWPSLPAYVASPSATPSPLPPGAPQSKSPSPTATPLVILSGTSSPYTTRVPSPSQTPLKPWAAGGTVLVLTTYYGATPSSPALNNSASGALALQAVVAEGAPVSTLPLGTVTATLSLPWASSDLPPEPMCTLPPLAAGGFGAVRPDGRGLTIACLSEQSGAPPWAARRHAAFTAGGAGQLQLGATATLQRLARGVTTIPPQAGAPLPHFTSLVPFTSVEGRAWLSNASGVYAAAIGAGAISDVAACALCGAAPDALGNARGNCTGGVIQLVARRVGFVSAASPGTVVLFASTPTRVLYATVASEAGSKCAEPGAALAGVAGKALRGFAFAADNTLYVADAGAGLLKWVAASAPRVGTAALRATWTLALTTAPAKVAGLHAVLFRNTAKGGPLLFATTPLVPGAAGNALYRYAAGAENATSATVPASAWTLVATAPPGSRYLALYPPPGDALATQTPLATATPTGTRPRSRSATPKKKM